MTTTPAPLALITGASAGLGRAIALDLARQGWRLLIDARNPVPLDRVAAECRVYTDVIAIAGDVARQPHRRLLADAVGPDQGLQLLVNNASTLASWEALRRRSGGRRFARERLAASITTIAASAMGTGWPNWR